MAGPGYIEGTTNHQYMIVQVDWSVNWTDWDSNKTSVHLELWAKRTNTGYVSSGTFTGGITIDGATYGQTSHHIDLTSSWLKLTEVDVEVTHAANGYKSIAVGAWGSLSGTSWTQTSLSGTITLDRTWGPPPLPTSVSGSRASDSQINVGITHGSAGPRNTVLSTQLQKKRVSSPATDWIQILDGSDAVTGFTDTGASANSAYVYRAAVWNYYSQVGWRESGTVYTTPGAPTSVIATKNADLSVSIGWSNGAAYQPANYRIYDNGTLILTVTGTVTNATHASPDASVIHVYTVSAVQGSLESVKTASNTIQLLTPPLAPTELSPAGINVLEGPVTLSWKHNPVDSTPQSGAYIRYRLVGASTWTVVAATTLSQITRTLAAGNYEYQVQTKGAHATYGAWSALATFSVVAAPVITISQPPTTLTTSIVATAWVWSQAQGLPQASWVAELQTSGGQRIELKSGNGPTSSVSFSTHLVDSTGYRVVVTGFNGGISASATKSFTTSFLPPATPSLSAVWDENLGCANISVLSGSASGGQPATVGLRVERSVDAGDRWELVADDLTSGTVITDFECLSAGSTIYRITAVSATPSYASSQTLLVTNSKAVWIGGGPGFGLSARLPFNPRIGVNAGREKTLLTYAGRSKPVSYSGELLNRVIQISGTFMHHYDSSHGVQASTADLDTLTALAQQGAPLHLYRNPDGLRIYGQLAPISMGPRDPAGIWPFSTTLTEAE